MKSRLIRTIFAMIAFMAMFVSVRGEDSAVDDELKKLDGEWSVPSLAGGDVVYRFKGKKLEIEAPNRSYKMTITVDPKAKPDKTIDFKIDEAPDDAKGKTSKGIYKIESDDTLVLCFTGEGDRPTKYEQVGFEQILTKLKRKAKGADKPEAKKPSSTVETVAPKAADRDTP
jgi:uncharacterized protein (TIGR03067 family)